MNRAKRAQPAKNRAAVVLADPRLLEVLRLRNENQEAVLWMPSINGLSLVVVVATIVVRAEMIVVAGIDVDRVAQVLSRVRQDSQINHCRTIPSRHCRV